MVLIIYLHCFGHHISLGRLKSFALPANLEGLGEGKESDASAAQGIHRDKPGLHDDATLRNVLVHRAEQ